MKFCCHRCFVGRHGYNGPNVLKPEDLLKFAICISATIRSHHQQHTNVKTSGQKKCRRRNILLGMSSVQSYILIPFCISNDDQKKTFHAYSCLLNLCIPSKAVNTMLLEIIIMLSSVTVKINPERTYEKSEFEAQISVRVRSEFCRRQS